MQTSIGQKTVFEIISLYIYSLIFDSIKGFIKVNTIHLRSGGTIKKATFGPYTYLQQNPNTKSKYAKMAQEGHNILWVVETKTGKYVSKVINKVITYI